MDNSLAVEQDEKDAGEFLHEYVGHLDPAHYGVRVLRLEHGGNVTDGETDRQTDRQGDSYNSHTMSEARVPC